MIHLPMRKHGTKMSWLPSEKESNTWAAMF